MIEPALNMIEWFKIFLNVQVKSQFPSFQRQLNIIAKGLKTYSATIFRTFVFKSSMSKLVLASKDVIIFLTYK